MNTLKKAWSLLCGAAICMIACVVCNEGDEEEG